MEIKEFINQTIDDVINGINEASLKAKDQGISIYMYDQPLDFDIAVTNVTTNDSKKEAGLNKILVAGISKSEEIQNSVASRIKFSANINVDNRDKKYPRIVTGSSTNKNRY